MDSLQDDMKQLLPMLVQFGFNQEAGTVQSKFAELLGVVKESLEVIWPSGKGELNATGIQVHIRKACAYLGLLSSLLNIDSAFHHVLFLFAGEFGAQCNSQQHPGIHECPTGACCHR